MATPNLDIWRHHYWFDISEQLVNLGSVDETNFDDDWALRQDTPNGAWLWSWLGRIYDQHSTTARRTIEIQVGAPGVGTAGCHTLRFEVTVRRHQTSSSITFPEPFDLVEPAAASSPAPTPPTTATPPAAPAAAPAPAPATTPVPAPATASSSAAPAPATSGPP